MSFHRHIFVFLLIGLGLTGCIPSERFWWSPEGDKVAVVVKGELRIADASGETLRVPEFPAAEGESSITEHVEWLADGETLITHRLRGFAMWADAKAEIPAEEAGRIETLAESVPAILHASLALGGDSDNLDVILARMNTKEVDALRNAFYLSYEKYPDTLIKILSEAPKLRSKLEAETAESERFVLNQLDSVTLDSDGKSSVTPLLKSIVLLSGMEVSPDGSQLLFGRRHGEKSLVDLSALDLKSGTETPVARRIFPAFTWQDDQTVLALTPVIAADSILKQLKQYTLGETQEPDAEILATALIPFLPKLERLPDNSLLLASQTGGLPATESSANPGSALYRYLPETRELLRIPTAEGALPMNLGFFTASPDGTQVAIVESDTDAVAVVEISTGAVTVISAPHPHAKCRTMPAWRNAKELTFAHLNEETQKVEWLMWERDGETRVLNSDWSPVLTADWIEIKKPDTH